MNKQQLAAKIWESANKMRSKIEANEYKDYILGFIFYKYLSDKQKSLIQAVYFDGMSVSDCAKHMGISQSAVSQQLKTIYKKLKKFL